MGGCAASEVDGADGGTEEGLPLVHLADQGLDVQGGLVAQGGGVEVAIDAAGGAEGDVDVDAGHGGTGEECGYRSEEQLNWICENKLYNVRVGNAKGSVEISPALVGAKYLLLYGAQGQFKYRLAETSPTLWSKEDLKKKGYSNPHHDFYFMFHLSEQLVDGDLAQMQIDINKLESLLRSKGKMDNIFGRDPFPISMTELVNCQSAE